MTILAQKQTMTFSRWGDLPPELKGEALSWTPPVTVARFRETNRHGKQIVDGSKTLRNKILVGKIESLASTIQSPDLKYEAHLKIAEKNPTRENIDRVSSLDDQTSFAEDFFHELQLRLHRLTNSNSLDIVKEEALKLGNTFKMVQSLKTISKVWGQYFIQAFNTPELINRCPCNILIIASRIDPTNRAIFEAAKNKALSEENGYYKIQYLVEIAAIDPSQENIDLAINALNNFKPYGSKAEKHKKRVYRELAVTIAQTDITMLASIEWEFVNAKFCHKIFKLAAQKNLIAAKTFLLTQEPKIPKNLLQGGIVAVVNQDLHASLKRKNTPPFPHPSTNSKEEIVTQILNHYLEDHTFIKKLDFDQIGDVLLLEIAETLAPFDFQTAKHLLSLEAFSSERFQTHFNVAKEDSSGEMLNALKNQIAHCQDIKLNKIKMLQTIAFYDPSNSYLDALNTYKTYEDRDTFAADWHGLKGKKRESYFHKRTNEIREFAAKRIFEVQLQRDVRGALDTLSLLRGSTYDRAVINLIDAAHSAYP